LLRNSNIRYKIYIAQERKRQNAETTTWDVLLGAVSACLVNHCDEKRKKNEPSHTQNFTVRIFTTDFSAPPLQLEKSLDNASLG